MSQSENIKDLATALSKAQSELKGALKDSSNPFFKSKYADLESVWEAARGPLFRNGLSVTQTTDFIEPVGICVITTLMHSSGQWISGRLPIMNGKNDPQGVGSALTYARRYSLAGIVGVVQIDDDAELASGRSNISEKHEIKNVTASIAESSMPVVMHSDSTPDWCGACKKKMLISKFNANESYCPGCKRKQQRMTA